MDPDNNMKSHQDCSKGEQGNMPEFLLIKCQYFAGSAQHPSGQLRGVLITRIQICLDQCSSIGGHNVADSYSCLIKGLIRGALLVPIY